MNNHQEVAESHEELPAQEEHADEVIGTVEHSTEEVHAKEEDHVEGGHHVVLAAEILGTYKIPFINQTLPITNTLVVSWITIAILIVLAFIIKFKVQAIPGKLQGLFEIIIDAAYSTAEGLAGSKTKVFFPFLMTFFLYIVLANWLGLFPGIGTITFDHKPLLRSINSDLNMTLGLALVSAFFTHFFAIRYLGIIDYVKKWVSLNPILLFVGVLELISEVTKVVSLSFRLFGNIFAGEVVLVTISSIFAFIVPLPFYFLEIIVGFVQAAVFMMLTLVFMVLLSEKHGAEEHH